MKSEDNKKTKDQRSEAEISSNSIKNLIQKPSRFSDENSRPKKNQRPKKIAFENPRELSMIILKIPRNF